MTMHSPLGYQVPAETARVASAAFPKGNLYMDLHAELGMLYTNQQFAHLFSTTGQPAEDPARLALVLVFQFLEGLSDRQAADSVRSRIDWKYALALELTDPGFDASVLCEFKGRLISGSAENLLLDTLLLQLQQRGLLKARGKQRTDSTHILAAVRSLNRLELLIETVRYALNQLADVAPAWLQPLIQPAWLERYAHRAENYRLPKAQTARDALATAVGADGFALLEAAFAEHTPAVVRAEPAVEVLRQVWVQQFYGPDDPPRLRPTNDAPPAGLLIASPYDVEARFSIKRGTEWTGYKAHITETCDEQTPNLIVNVLTTAATVQDDTVLSAIHAALEQKQLLPAEHLVDSGYTNVTNLQQSTQRYQVDVVGPVATDPSWQARTKTGFDHTQFSIDWEQQVVTCPAGKRSVSWLPLNDGRANAAHLVRFARADCAACESREQCTQSTRTGRQLTLDTKERYLLLAQARQRQQSEGFKALYALRSGVESMISQAVRACELRRTRYSGQARTHLQHIVTVVAINLIRLVAWLSPSSGPRRVSAFSRLAAIG
ncbi:IS1182 family transposase [Scytonema tolypothrichoides VB-61278]|nr:IS1182 family transposase [Scytonema tolypothrichoides VB-61278]